MYLHLARLELLKNLVYMCSVKVFSEHRAKFSLDVSLALSVLHPCSLLYSFPVHQYQAYRTGERIFQDGRFSVLVPTVYVEGLFQITY